MVDEPIANDEEELFGGEAIILEEVKQDESELDAQLFAKGITDTVLIFRKDTFFMYDFNSKSGWQIGDITEASLRDTVRDNSSVVAVIPEEHKTNEMQAIVSGGWEPTIRSGSQDTFSLSFQSEFVNTVKNYMCTANKELPPMLFNRYMHQSVIVKGKTGAFTLIAIGGKTDVNNWTNSVEQLILTPYFRTGMTTKDESGKLVALTSEWTRCADMSSARSNFAVLNFRNTVYVFGGIQGAGAEGEPHRPVIVEHTIERYLPQIDRWEDIKIPNAPSLAAFSWAVMDEHSLIILGGTDGNIMLEDMYVIDLK